MKNALGFNTSIAVSLCVEFLPFACEVLALTGASKCQSFRYRYLLYRSYRSLVMWLIIKHASD